MWFDELGVKDVPIVGGKNASLGEMYQRLTPRGVSVPNGFATTAFAYRAFVKEAKLDKAIRSILRGLDTKSIANLQERGHAAEDLPDASFAGQQETFLNIRGPEALIDACKRCFASLFTDRAISYRQDKKFDHFKIALSIGVQKMVRSDRASSGVMFSIDTESGFPNAVIINGSWGLGENIVQGSVTPDEWRVFKPTLAQEKQAILSRVLGDKKVKMIYTTDRTRPTKNIPTSTSERVRFCLSDKEVEQLARWAVVIEQHYHKPMDMEWAKDGKTKKLFIVQARPETVMSRRNTNILQEFRLGKKGTILCQGQSVGRKIGQGKETCIFVAVGGGGFLCEKFSGSTARMMLDRFATRTMNAGRIGNCAVLGRKD
ncbi:MAG: Phosphoenolpyruvate synthase [Candidatus Uhrbacteria bacterium GW2011_GWA2_52_8d]|uniref:Phosphoenolpyruvate synthase n=1 Tax=Candidatus Uhrbacteria bacterium GW2011_GWA2_52_8d TaxID=1618979 RepID=A0A0G1ZTL9_9BACT|nr:MAG: Phosphoenolpyruvate synthase [Candidatus Uhrbacteria bacterium GW2011_GWA2_52_8d]